MNIKPLLVPVALVVLAGCNVGKVRFALRLAEGTRSVETARQGIAGAAQKQSTGPLTEAIIEQFAADAHRTAHRGTDGEETGAGQQQFGWAQACSGVACARSSTPGSVNLGGC